jgi:flagellum-specific peptidoglycan hydrolase FlgJ
MKRIFLLFVCLTISVVSFGQDKAASSAAASEIPPGSSMEETTAWIKRELKAMGSDHITTHITTPYKEATFDDKYGIESAVLSECVLTIRQVIQHDGNPNHQTDIRTITMKDVGRVDVRETTVAPGITMSKPIYFVILTAIPDRGEPFLLEGEGYPVDSGGNAKMSVHVIRVQIRDQNEANQVADVFRRAAVLCGAPSQPVGTAVTEPAQEQLTAEEIQNIVTKSTAGQFASPLAEKTLSEFLVAESNRTGVPAWLVLAQAKRETSFGSPQNGTVQDGRTFENGTKGNAHNLFNIRPGSSWTGKILDLGTGSGKFRVYDSYQDSVRDYMRLMSSNTYKGQTLHGLVYKYFPPSDNGGSAATERYIDTIINFAASQGITITRDTVVVP